MAVGQGVQKVRKSMEELKQRTNSFIKKMTNLGLDSLSFTMVYVDMHIAGFLTSNLRPSGANN